MADRGEHVAALFEAALSLDPRQRSAFLDRACGDSSLRDEVEELLRADAAAGSFLKDRVYQLPTTDDGHASQATIGPYTLLEVIGQGGMGEVWLDEQRQPVRRRVAIKLIKVGMDTKEVVARFESERQALALMDHPAIAKVFDAGSTPEGRPYFVMEYAAFAALTSVDTTGSLSERYHDFGRSVRIESDRHSTGLIKECIILGVVLTARRNSINPVVPRSETAEGEIAVPVSIPLERRLSMRSAGRHKPAYRRHLPYRLVQQGWMLRTPSALQR
jgi:hypothetical protein